MSADGSARMSSTRDQALNGCGYFGTTANLRKISRLGRFGPLGMTVWSRDIGITPVLWSVTMLGLGHFGLLPQDCVREFFEAAEQGP